MECISCGDERAEGSQMCAECLSTASKCKSCGVALVDHMGHQGQCAELQRVKATNAELVVACAELMVVCAWMNADLSEGQVSKFLGHDRVECRRMKELFIANGIGIVDAKARGEQ